MRAVTQCAAPIGPRPPPVAATRKCRIRAGWLGRGRWIGCGSGSGSGRRSAAPRPDGGRYLRRIPSGLLRVDHTVIKREAHLDGKWLLGGREPQRLVCRPARTEDLGRSSLLQVQPHPLAGVLRVYHGAHLMVHGAGLHEMDVADQAGVAHRDLDMRSLTEERAREGGRSLGEHPRTERIRMPSRSRIATVSSTTSRSSRCSRLVCREPEHPAPVWSGAARRAPGPGPAPSPHCP
jgi:hypothetical protein